METKKTKRRRNTRLILAFFVLLWLGLSTSVYFRDTGPSKIYTQKSRNAQYRGVWITREGDEYVCKIDSSEAPFHGRFGFVHEYNTYASRTKVVLKEEWRIRVGGDELPEDADQEKLFDEGYALLVAQGLRPNWPNITRAQANNYVVEYPDRIAKNKRAIALHAIGSTAPALAILCGFVLVARHIWIASRDSPRPGICPDCDYNLDGLDQQQCPECGRAFSDEEWFFHMPG